MRCVIKQEFKFEDNKHPWKIIEQPWEPSKCLGVRHTIYYSLKKSRRLPCIIQSIGVKSMHFQSTSDSFGKNLSIELI